MYNVEVAAGLCGSKTKMGSKICRNVGVRPRFLIPEMGADQLYFWEKINFIYKWLLRINDASSMCFHVEAFIPFVSE